MRFLKKKAKIKMTQGPLVSVIVPLYNHEKYIEQAIQSVVSQTYQSWELIIIDDGSSDLSVKKSAYIYRQAYSSVWTGKSRCAPRN